MAAHVNGGTGTEGTEGGGIPGPIPPYAGTLVRRRRRHDRSKYPWRYQRFRRKMIQITVVSSIALLFLCGALYVMLSSSRSPSSDSSTPASRAVSVAA
jgi:hypothetical protein